MPIGRGAHFFTPELVDQMFERAIRGQFLQLRNALSDRPHRVGGIDRSGDPYRAFGQSARSAVHTGSDIGTSSTDHSALTWKQ
ncbi:hypothetical protein GCM10009830_13470 [Glycomyces endophyticus]|uniref:Uncharacterized protein n=1 Tax=Glycomyces endophyticus TaxID=480996 RepID=A0ABN2GCJ6_9ACTN